MKLSYVLPALAVTPLVPAALIAEIVPFAEYRLGETGSLGNAGGNTAAAPLDTSGNNRNVTNSNGGNAVTTVTTDAFAPSSTAYVDLSDASNNGWYSATPIFDTLPQDNFALGVYARAADLSAAGTIFGTGGTGGFHLGLSSAGWSAWVSNGSGGATSWIGNTNGTTGSFSANTWVHLAVIRRDGVSTFYINQAVQGATSSVAPTHGTVHIGVNPGGNNAFDGFIDEARVLTFDAGSTNEQVLNALQQRVVPLPPRTLAEQSFPTADGKRYIATFTLGMTPSTALPAVTLNATGTEQLLSQILPTSLPANGTSAPFWVSFTADAAQTNIRLTRPMGSSGADPVVTGLQIREAVEPSASDNPSITQQEQIDRRYGMFIHYGINTFHNQQWTDGSKPPSSYAPTGLDVDQWVRTARDAGMKHIILTAKHHEGFCLWDSAWTTYDVASSPVTTDVIAAAAAACKKYDIGFGLYYSLWDRHDSSYATDAAYNQYMLRQLTELMTNYGPICELWLDGGWDKANTRWASSELYDLVKRLQPECLISTNWTIGTPTNIDSAAQPNQQQNGYPIRYFPSDFRTGDPALPGFPDPKLFSHSGQNYYMPFEATITLSSNDYWFYDTRDSGPKPLATLANFYYTATGQNNILILNAPPDRSGTIREVDRQRLIELRDFLGLKPGMPMPKNTTRGATGTASATWNNDVANLGPQMALDENPNTRWACGPGGTTSATFDIDFGSSRSFDRIMIDEYEPSAGVGRIQAFRLQSWNGTNWQTFYTGTSCGRRSLHNFPRINATKIRLSIDQSTDAPSIWEIQTMDSAHAYSSWRDSYFPGSTVPMDSDWNADPDGDGLSNRLEFAMGTDPLHRTKLPTPQVDGNMLKVDLPWSPDATSDFGRLVYSLDLEHWHDARTPIHPGVNAIVNSGTMQSISVNPNVQSHWFYRLQ